MQGPRNSQTLLASAARTTLANSDDQGYPVKGAMFFLSVTVAAGGNAGLTLQIQAKDTVGNGYVTFTDFASQIVVDDETYLYVVYPNEAGSYPGHVQHHSGPLPSYRWRARVVPNDVTSITYSLSASFLE